MLSYILFAPTLMISLSRECYRDPNKKVAQKKVFEGAGLAKVCSFQTFCNWYGAGLRLIELASSSE